jgi:hypothetical protein
MDVRASVSNLVGVLLIDFVFDLVTVLLVEFMGSYLNQI